VAGRRLLHADRRPVAKLSRSDNRAGKFQCGAGSAADGIKEEIGADLNQTGRTGCFNHYAGGERKLSAGHDASVTKPGVLDVDVGIGTVGRSRAQVSHADVAVCIDEKAVVGDKTRIDRSIGTGASVKRVVAGAALEDVVARQSVDRVVGRTTEDEVVAA